MFICRLIPKQWLSFKTWCKVSVKQAEGHLPRGLTAAKQQGPLFLVQWQGRKSVLLLITLGELRWILPRT